MVTETKNSKTPTEDKPYKLWKEDDWWIVRNEGTGVVTQGETAQKALENLGEAIDCHLGPANMDEEDREELLREIGYSSEEIKEIREGRSESKELPEFMR